MAFNLPSSPDDLRALIQEATAAYNAAQERERQEEQQERQAIVDAIGTLEALLGPVGAAPSTDSIRGVLAFGTETIQANSAAAVPLILLGLDQLTQTVLSIAKVVESSQNN